MYQRIYRYDQDSDALMLQVLNFTNKTLFEPWQVEFTEPVPMDDDTYTCMEIKPTAATGWTKSENLFYHREKLQDHFQLVDFVVYIDEHTGEGVLKALREQYKLNLEAKYATVVMQKASLSDMILVHHLGGFFDPGPCGDITPPITYTATVTVDNHPYWMGQIKVYVRESLRFLDRSIKNTLQVKAYLMQNNQSKIPTDMVIDFTKVVKDEDRILQILKKDALINPAILPIAESLTHDNWVFSPVPSPFNLYAARVIYNGDNTAEYYTGNPRVNKVVVLELSESYCTNLRGYWHIGYYDPITQLRLQRLDMSPLQDQ